MKVSQYVEDIYQRQTQEFLGCDAFGRLERGDATLADYDRFIGNVFRTHQNSPQFLAFLFSVAPPTALDRVAHNLLEELGIEEEGGQSHPALLTALIEGAGLGAHAESLREAARETMRGVVCEPFLFGSFREVGLGAMAEVFSFEHMLAHSSTRIADMLATHRGLGEDALTWFRHHSEVDIGHAEEALLTIEETAEYYEFDFEEACDVIDLTMRENVFIKRYFDPETLAATRNLL